MVLELLSSHLLVFRPQKEVQTNILTGFLLRLFQLRNEVHWSN